MGFRLDGPELTWQKWRFRFTVHPREGLVLHTVGYEDQGRIRSILYDVHKNPKGPQLVLSRTDPRLLIRLFEMEVPEIYDNIKQAHKTAIVATVKAEGGFLGWVDRMLSS